MAADRELFEEELRTLYGAHHQGAKQATVNHGTSSLPKLKRMLDAGAKHNLQQAKRLEHVFQLIGATPFRRHDAGMQGIIDANNELVAKHRGAVERDLINIAYGQVAAHLYLAKYGTLRSYAKGLGHPRAAHLLQTSLEETRAIDRAFSRLADDLVKRSPSARYPGKRSLTGTAAMHPALATSLLLAVLLGSGDSKARRRMPGSRSGAIDDRRETSSGSLPRS